MNIVTITAALMTQIAADAGATIEAMQAPFI
jgi:hypothetical protein